MKKKIGILTQPLHNNYGGLLQAYALKEVLISLGHEVIIINRRSGQSSQIRKIASNLKNKVTGRKIIQKVQLSNIEKNTISQNTSAFRKKYIPNLSETVITTNNGMKRLNNMEFDAYIVGSDQSWRPRYSPAIRNYFLDFAKNQKNIKRLSYAVSFGVSDWEFNQMDTKACATLVKKFDAISVREDSGLRLINDYLGSNAVHLIDPTMLLSIDQYLKIISEEKIERSEGLLKVYILDKTEEKLNFVSYLESELNLKQFQVMPTKRLGSDSIENIEDYVYPNPAKWLRGYQDAKFVVADSFHGTVFAILFNIPFIAIGNKTRGLARFESLLKMFGLEERFVTDLKSLDIDKYIKNDIDWNSVNLILEKEKEKALNFLINNLK